MSFELNGHRFSQPRLFLKKGGSVGNKLGLSSWLVLMDEVPVKIYECHDESQALFIKEVSTSTPLTPYLPSCLMVIGKYLVVEWVRGKQVTWKWASKDEGLLSEIAKLQALIHRVEMKTPQITKCYYADFLKRRVAKYKGVFPIDEAIEEIYKTIDQGSLLDHDRISHPDVTGVNLILENKTGVPKIIDNELMTQNSYYLFDLFNTHGSFGKQRDQLAERYLSHYLQSGGNLTPLVEHERFFEAMWYLRLIGTKLQSGSLRRAFALASAYADKPRETHPLIRLVKEKFI